MVHDASRCGFVLYGVTSKQLKQMDQLLLDGIQNMLEAECIAPEIVQQYLLDCGSAIRYTKTKDRSAVSRLNRFTQLVERMAGKLREDELFQPYLLLWANDDIISSKKQYFHTRQLLREGFAAHYPDQTVFRYSMVTLEIRLRLHTTCYRRVRIPLRQSLHDLHRTLQILFGWKDYHMHTFELEPGLPLDVTMPEYARFAETDDWDNCDTEPMEFCIPLAEVLEQYPQFSYIYDMGDYWEHEIRLVSQEDDPVCSDPQCILAVGDAPPEDVGGADGYADLLERLNHPQDPDYAEAKEWLEESGWKPLDMQQLQQLLNQQRRFW